MTTSISQVDTSVLQSMVWRQVGPFRGGRVIAVAGHPTEKTTFYMGSTGGGVWKTDDAGNTWENLSDGYFGRASVGAIAVAESDPNVIYAGMGESTIRSNVSHGDGVYKSTDGGRSWSHLGLTETRNIGKVRVHPNDPDIVYVAALGHAHGPNPERGVFRSNDGGENWEHVLFRSDKAGAVDLSLDVMNPRIMYAAFWEGVHRAHDLVSGGPGSGLFCSTDSGDTWEEISRNRGLPQEGLLGRMGIVASPAQPGRIWAIIEAQDGGGFFRSDDYGDTWQNVYESREIRQRPWYYMHVFADPKDPETVWVLNERCWKSNDGGHSFHQVPGTHGDFHDLWIDPTDSNRLIQGNDGGATVSFTGGDSWSTILNQPTSEFYHVTTDNQVPYRIYGAQQDNTTISVPSRTHLPAIAWGEAYEVGGGESGYIAVRPDDPNIVYAGLYKGILTRYDHRTGQRSDVMVWPEESTGWAEGDLKYRFQWTFPIVISPYDPNVLYVTSQFVHRSTNEGQSWEIISPDLTRNDPEKMTPSGGPITPDNNSMNTYCTIFAFAESPVEKGVLWAGSDDGLLHVSRDDGETWTNVTPPDLPTWSLVSIIEASPHSGDTAYVAVDRHRHDDFQPYLYKTHDYGESWTRITSHIPSDEFARVIREDPNRRGLLYAGTEAGIYLSLDDGDNWHPFRLNLPVVPIHDLVITEKDLVAATHGRSFWVLDDLTPLYHLTPDELEEKAALIPPRDTIRFWNHSRGTQRAIPGQKNFLMWGMTYRAETDADGEVRIKWLDAGENPPTGVIVYYHLRDQAENVTLTFLDQDGNEIRGFSSQDPENGNGTGGKQNSRIPAQVGLNRFAWNMRYPDAYSFKDEKYKHPEGALGPIAPPGTYQVRLCVGDYCKTESFTIHKDPRVSATQQDFEAQFNLLIQIRDKLSEANEAVAKIRDLRDQLKLWTERTEAYDGSGDLPSVADRLEQQLTHIEEELVQTKWIVSRDDLTAPIMLNAKLASLAAYVGSGGGAKPTQQQHQVFEELSVQIDTHLSELSEITEKEVPRFNDMVRETGLPAVAARNTRHAIEH